MERFFHIRMPNSNRGGATVRVVSDIDNGALVHVSVAYCSAGDQFCRKVGRDLATEAKVHTMDLEQLPEKLARVARRVVTRTPGISRSRRVEQELWQRDYSFATKYFTAKPDTGDTNGGAPAAEVFIPAFLRADEVQGVH